MSQYLQEYPSFTVRSLRVRRSSRKLWTAERVTLPQTVHLPEPVATVAFEGPCGNLQGAMHVTVAPHVNTDRYASASPLAV